MRGRPLDWLIGLGLVVFLVGSLVLQASVGFLLDHPLAHLLLTGSISAQIAGGALVRDGSMELAVVVPAAVFGCIMFDPLFWLIGRRYGNAAVHWAQRRGMVRPAHVARLERLIERYGTWAVLVSWYVPIPNALIFIAVGEAGMRFLVFLVLDVIAALLWVALLVGLGYAIGDPALRVADAITHYSWWVLGGVFAVTFLVVLLQQRGRTPRRG